MKHALSPINHNKYIVTKQTGHQRRQLPSYTRADMLRQNDPLNSCLMQIDLLRIHHIFAHLYTTHSNNKVAVLFRNLFSIAKRLQAFSRGCIRFHFDLVLAEGIIYDRGNQFFVYRQMQCGQKIGSTPLAENCATHLLSEILVYVRAKCIENNIRILVYRFSHR